MSPADGAARRPARPARPAKPYRKPRRDPVRLVAYDVLRAVEERDAYANLILPALLREARLDRRDSALATELAYGTLRNQGSYDAILAACVDRPLREVDSPVLDVLCLGAHQILGTRIPRHAAVSTTVDLARQVLGEGRAKFVNAVLRKVTAHDLDDWLDLVAPDPAKDPEGNLAVRHSHPEWVVSALWNSLGRWRPGTGPTEVAELLAADNSRPEVTLVARPGRSTPAELTEQLAETERTSESGEAAEPEDPTDPTDHTDHTDPAAPGRWSPYAVRMLHGGDPAQLDAVRTGRAGVQDEGSQLVALALAAAPLDGPDERWLDGCAGPGGKAALLGALATGRGAHLLAAERQPHRAELVARALNGAPGGHRIMVADSTRPGWQPGSFDRVLMDVPCSGLGALRRRPEARWRRRPEDIASFAPLQRQLLRTALSSVRVGGIVGYATCSPHLAETRGIVEEVLDGGGPWQVEPVDARPLLPGVPELGEGPDIQLWPHVHGTDAMYLALLRRTA
jgi:16S rRNA (cytosine967-C5)-methyltransferase